MGTPRRSAKEQLHLVEACRASGLTIREWCIREGINIDTFYSWTERLTKRGFLEKPVTIPQQIIREPQSPDIVKVEISTPTVSAISPIVNPKAQMDAHYPTSTKGAVMEIAIGEIRVKVTNNINLQLLAETLRMLGGGNRC